MTTKNTGREPSFYIAVLLYEATSDAADEELLYEESFILIRAVSDEEAQAKALSYANEPFSYKNQYGQTITWSLKQLVSVQLALSEQFTDGTEFYARYFRDYEAYRLALLTPFPDE